MRRQLILSTIIALLLVGALAAGLAGSGAYFSDTETSAGNAFAAGTLDLAVDDANGGDDVLKFTVGGMKPGNQPKGTFTLANVGTNAGYLDIESIVVNSQENDISEPEAEAGDTSDAVGELQDVLNVRLFHDVDGDGWIGTGETVFYNGKVKDLPAGFDQNIAIPADGKTCITAIFDWWETSIDNQAQGDSLTLSMAFELGQTDKQ